MISHRYFSFHRRYRAFHGRYHAFNTHPLAFQILQMLIQGPHDIEIMVIQNICNLFEAESPLPVKQDLLQQVKLPGTVEPVTGIACPQRL